MSKHEAKVAIKDSFCQISGAAIALLFGVAMVNLYRYTSNANIGAKVASTVIDTFDYTNSSMLYVMADALAIFFMVHTLLSLHLSVYSAPLCQDHVPYPTPYFLPCNLKQLLC